MRPSRLVFKVADGEVDFSETSKTARALLSASATNNLDPSGDKASALGVLPSEAPLVAASLMYSNTFFFFVSSTAILSVPARATNKREPEAFDSKAEGSRPT